ncbi:transmembrane-type terpene cyclase [Weissella fangxianensis]|uniref:transmembrane-type terpene cyclase n=1 Tax=Weissella fangxianensis TaxID=2953879 RepID=UPI0021573143|nr:hypothetical protein [Weissella fangxianensis]
MTLFLQLLSGICWSIVYIELIRKGIKDRTYGMPVFALGLNFAWETIYAFSGLTTSITDPQSWVNLIWALLDVGIIVTFFRYGKRDFPNLFQNYFYLGSIAIFIVCFIFQFAFLFEFGNHWGSIYSAFAQNAAMSILFVSMLLSRNSSRGQSQLMAYSKWIGTLAPSILGGLIEQVNIYVILTGVICFVFDLVYIILLSKIDKQGLAINFGQYPKF